MRPNAPSPASGGDAAPTMLRRRLSDEIRVAANQIRSARRSRDASQPADLRVLRRLQGWCDRALLVAEHPTDRFLLFFLSMFLQDLFFNLAGELPYEEAIEEKKQDFYRTLGTRLLGLATELSSPSSAAYLRACERLVGSYLDLIARINEHGTP